MHSWPHQPADESPRRAPRSLLDAAVELPLLLAGLEAPVPELGRRVDELEVDLLESNASALRQERLTEGDQALAHTDNRALEHDVVLVDLAVVREAAHRRDRLLREIVLGHGVVRILLDALADAVDLLVDLRAVVIAELTGAGGLELHALRVPRANARDFAEPAVRLARKTSDAPARNDALPSATLRHADRVDHLIVGEHGTNRDLLLEHLRAEVNLLRDGAAVHLDLHNVRLLLPDLRLGNLGVADRTDNLAVVLRALDLGLDLVRHRLVLAVEVLRVLGEGLLLRAVPVLVEAPAHLVAEMRGPDRRKRTEAVDGLRVPNEADADHQRALDDGDGLRGLLLVELRPRLIHVAHDVRHAGLVAHEGRKVARLRGVILREALHLAVHPLRALPREEAQRPAPRVSKLTVGHEKGKRRVLELE